MATRLPRRLRTVGGRWVRRLRLLPEGDPDGLGDDETLRGLTLPFAVMVYFADTPRNLYQLRQWYAPLRELDRRHRVGVVCLDSRTAAAVRAELTPLPVLCVGRIGTLEDLVSRSDVALALYVNHNPRNFHPLRFPTMLHAYLGHGESDKASSASNQVKAYDVVLVPGEVGKHRLGRNLLCYDAEAHVRLVGRPQLDAGSSASSVPSDQPTGAGRATVLYAPTWEGAQPSMAYGSVMSHGEKLLQSLLDSGRFHVSYRPHPRVGANRADYAAADAQLRALVERAAALDPEGRHRVDTAPDWTARSEPADLLVCDVSAVAADWVATGRPLVVTVPAAGSAAVESGSVLEVVRGLRVEEAGEAADIVAAELAAPPSSDRAAWLRRALGDTSPGAATARFLEVCEELVALRGRELASRAGRLR